MEESGLEPWSVGRELGIEGDGGVRAGTLECGEGARERGMEVLRLEPWSVERVLRKRRRWRKGIN